jgi:hypothetical protein
VCGERHTPPSGRSRGVKLDQAFVISLADPPKHRPVSAVLLDRDSGHWQGCLVFKKEWPNQR